MIADPLSDVGLRRENALLQRSLPRELQMLLLAQIGLSNLADHHHDLNESHWRHRRALPGAAIYARVPAELSIFSTGEAGDGREAGRSTESVAA
jgi:hypothetical protein